MKFVDGRVTDTAQLVEKQKAMPILAKRNLPSSRSRSCWFRRRHIQQLAEMFRGGFAKHAHFYRSGIRSSDKVFRRAGDGVNEVVDAFEKVEVGDLFILSIRVPEREDVITLCRKGK